MRDKYFAWSIDLAAAVAQTLTALKRADCLETIEGGVVS
jgi:hypothetical protein